MNPPHLRITVLDEHLQARFRQRHPTSFRAFICLGERPVISFPAKALVIKHRIIPIEVAEHQLRSPLGIPNANLQQQRTIRTSIPSPALENPTSLLKPLHLKVAKRVSRRTRAPKPAGNAHPPRHLRSTQPPEKPAAIPEFQHPLTAGHPQHIQLGSVRKLRLTQRL
jgi:hypothetical protein